MLWRSRQWRLLLNLIDHLPADSHTTAVLLNDREYVDMVMEERKRRERAGEKLSSRPSLASWTQEASILAVVVDRLAALIESNSASPKAVRPYARPETAFEAYDRDDQQRVHDKLVAGLIAGA